MKKNFKCEHCKKTVLVEERMITHHRNHCPYCLWSKHLDFLQSGDRKSSCYGLMKPIAITFKKEGKDKYGREREGDVMIVHECQKCGKISINRIAGDDKEEMILKVFEDSQKLPKSKKNQLKKEGIKILSKKDKKRLLIKLFGKYNF